MWDESKSGDTMWDDGTFNLRDKVSKKNLDESGICLSSVGR